MKARYPFFTLLFFLFSQSINAESVKLVKKKKARQRQTETSDKNPNSQQELQEHILTNMGFGKGLSFETSDKQNFLNMRVRFQERATETVKQEEGEKQTEGLEFQARRARLVFSGNFLGKDWQYYVQLSFSNLDMEEDRPVPLRDASLSYTKFNNVNIKVGQMKVPYNRQRFISDGLQEFVDRTVSNEELNLDRDVGVLVSSSNLFGWNCLGYSAGVFGGEGRNRSSNSSGVLTSAKFTYYPLGVFSDNGEPDLEHSTKPKLALSVAGANNQNTNRELSTHGDTYQFARFDYTNTGAEFLFQWKGLSASGEYLTRKANSPFMEKEIGNQTLKEYSRSVKGGFFQLGYLFKNNLGVALRYSEYRPWGKTDPKLTYSRERGLAVSYYLKDHNLKIQADYAYLEGGYVDSLGSHRIRAQIQVFL